MRPTLAAMWCVRPWLLFGVFFLGACSGEHDAIEKRLAELGKDIQRLQSSNDALSDRLEGLEAKVTRVGAAAPAEGGSRLERPPLRVVKLVPGSPSGVAASEESVEVAAEERPDAPGQRPVIRLRGGATGKETRSRDGSAKLAQTPSEEDP